MAIVVRRMNVEDMADVKRVDVLSFGAIVEVLYPGAGRLPSRTDDNILSYMRSDPEGSLVAVDELAGIVGSSFSHVWGRTGWVGPVSVLPSYHGKGVGKELVKASLEYLDIKRCTDIGLETMPEVGASMGMYLRMGLRPSGLVIAMGKSISKRPKERRQADEVLVERYSASRSKDMFLLRIKKLSDSLHQGLDYSSEVVLAHEYSLGDTLIASMSGELAGFSIVHTAPRREGMQNALVKALAIAPSAGDAPLEPLLDASEDLAAEDRSSELSVAVPGVSQRALDLLLSRGYSVVQTFERMMWLGAPGVGQKTFNLCSWSG